MLIALTFIALLFKVIPRVGALVDYFGLAVIRQIEKMGVLILNNLESINISRDKLWTLQQLAAHGIPIPKTLVAKFPLELDVIERELSYPVILKKVAGSQGKGIVKLDSREQVKYACCLFCLLLVIMIIFFFVPQFAFINSV